MSSSGFDSDDPSDVRLADILVLAYEKHANGELNRPMLNHGHGGIDPVVY